MDFNDLYLFVGPPMTRGPPQVPILPSLLPPLPPPSPMLPPMLPRPPMYSKRTQKQNTRIKPYHRLKPSQRYPDDQVRTRAKSVDIYESNEPEMQLMMSELELEYRTSKKDWLNTLTPDFRGENACGDSQATWSTVLEMCPQFFSIDPSVGEYF
ncbi:hypothetical protein P3T76_002261 [Phytophthora citrophthora]|uniref:Uncharacterized protein n=1 Tax=Phytophthora citrophthora TaxID=4793 RepID=A0AAD9GX58_9STRA|nr:hypothetical protein P3T76_002261 [Phytophthora citrophthora]